MNPDLMRLALMFTEAGGEGGSGGGTATTGTTTADVPPKPDDPPTGKGSDGGRGFPAETPVNEMSVEEQAAYWKFHSRKWQGRAETRNDYDEVKAERDRLKAASLTDQEKAIEDAKKAAKDEALREFAPTTVKTMLTGILTAVGLKDEEIEAKLEFADLSKFLTPKGEVDTDKVKTFVSGVAPGTGNGTWPDMGGGRRGDPNGKKAGGSVQSGRDAYIARHSKKTT